MPLASAVEQFRIAHHLREVIERRGLGVHTGAQAAKVLERAPGLPQKRVIGVGVRGFKVPDDLTQVVDGIGGGGVGPGAERAVKVDELPVGLPQERVGKRAENLQVEIADYLTNAIDVQGARLHQVVWPVRIAGAAKCLESTVEVNEALVVHALGVPVWGPHRANDLAPGVEGPGEGRGGQRRAQVKQLAVPVKEGVTGPAL